MQVIDWSFRWSGANWASVMAYQITGNTNVCSTADPGWQQKKHQSSAWLALCGMWWWGGGGGWIPTVTDGFLPSWPVLFTFSWASWQIRILADWACAGNAGNVLPATSGFLWSQWRGKRSRHSKCMNTPHFYVSSKRPTAWRYHGFPAPMYTAHCHVTQQKYHILM